MSPAEMASLLFAGLGLFFIGIKLIGAHLAQTTGRGLRNQIVRLAGRSWSSCLLGVVFGALTQSTNAVTFIMSSMITAGLMPVRAAMPLVIWANLGTSALVLLASVNIHLFVLCLLGFVGTAYFFNIDKSQRYRHVAAALLGVALLFLGLDFLKQGAAPLRDVAEVRTLLTLAAQSYGLVFVLGAALTLATQSSATVTVVALTMTQLDLLQMDQALMVIYGAGLGSAGSLLFMASGLQGTARQLVSIQIFLKTLASLLMVVLFIVELETGVELVRALITTITDNTSLQGAWAYLLMQLLGCTVVSACASPLHRLAQRLSPATHEEERAKPRFLYEQALGDAPTALALVVKEQSRQLDYLPQYLEHTDRALRAPDASAGNPESLHAANQAIITTTRAFLSELMDRAADRELLDQMLNLQSRNQVLSDLQDGLYRFNAVQKLHRSGDAGDEIAQAMVEGIDFILLSLLDAAHSGTRDDRALLLDITADKSSLIEASRQRFLRISHGLSPTALESLFSAFSLFERLVWLLRQYGLLIDAFEREAP